MLTKNVVRSKELPTKAISWSFNPTSKVLATTKHHKMLLFFPTSLPPLLTTWAETANITVDEQVTQLLADVLKIKGT